MDDLTHAFYDAYAGRLKSQPEARRSAMMTLAERFFRSGDVVLDVGAGSGRDVAALRSLGMEAVGVEPNAPMRDHALTTHPELAGWVRDGGLPTLGHPFQDLYPQGFDGVVCSAVLDPRHARDQRRRAGLHRHSMAFPCLLSKRIA